MEEDKSQLMNCAMIGGLYLGAFWILKYLLVINVARHPALSFFSSLLSLGTPVILFYNLLRYKNNNTKKNISFIHGLQFGIMLFFFASILEAVVVFIHITWIDPSFIGNLYANMIETLKSINLSEKMIHSLENQPLPSTMNYLISNVVLTNVFIGILLSLILIPLANRLDVGNFSSRFINKNE